MAQRTSKNVHKRSHRLTYYIPHAITTILVASSFVKSLRMPPLFPIRHHQKPSSSSTILSDDNFIHKYNLTVISEKDLVLCFRNKDESFSRINECFMEIALNEAKYAADEKNEVPIGAVVVQHLNSIKENESGSCYRILAREHNLVETLQDASAHAEILALRSASKTLGNWRLSVPQNNQHRKSEEEEQGEVTLYCTLEPCPMCLYAIKAFRVCNIVYGANDLRLGAIESYVNFLNYDDQDKKPTSSFLHNNDDSDDDHKTSYSLPPHPYHPQGGKMNVVKGVKEEECGAIIRDFFRLRRKLKKKNNLDKNKNDNHPESTNVNTKRQCLSLLRRKRKTFVYLFRNLRNR